MAYEKYLRENTLGPTSDDESITKPTGGLQEDSNNPVAGDAGIWEKTLTHREGYEQTIVEDHLKSEHKLADSDDSQIIEKVLDEVEGKYVDHRNDDAWLPVPPIQALVERIRQGRSGDWEVDKKSHWSQTFNEKKQQGSLPKWKKDAPQHDKVVLNNDPERFKGDDVTPLVGKITKADVNRIAHAVKTGQSLNYDAIILAVLNQADSDERELNETERQAIAQLKIERTNSFLQHD